MGTNWKMCFASLEIVFFKRCSFSGIKHRKVTHVYGLSSNIFLRFYYGGRVTHPCRATVASSDIMHDVRFVSPGSHTRSESS